MVAFPSGTLACGSVGNVVVQAACRRFRPARDGTGTFIAQKASTASTARTKRKRRMLRWSLTCLILALSALFVGFSDSTVALGEVARMVFLGLMAALVL